MSKTLMNKDEYADGFADGYKAGRKFYELGCEGCAFQSTEEWEMPCVRCKRGCKDYYRYRPTEEVE